MRVIDKLIILGILALFFAPGLYELVFDKPIS
jgi:hypothetical protein